MSLYALIQNNVVVGLYQPSDDHELSRITPVFQATVDVTDMYPAPSIGDVLVGNQIVNPDGSPILNWKVTRLAFMERFEPSELAAVYAFAANGTQTGYEIKAYLDMVNASTYIDLSRPDTVADVGVLVALGLITSAREQAILTTVPTSTEQWTPS